MANNNVDIRILVGSEEQSTNIIRKELESAFSKDALQIMAKLSDSALQTIQKQLDSLKINVYGAGAGAGSGKGKSPSVPVADYKGATVSTRAMSQATKELTDAKVKAINTLNREKVANEKAIGAAKIVTAQKRADIEAERVVSEKAIGVAKTAAAQARADIVVIRQKETVRKAGIAIAKDLQAAEDKLARTQEQAYKKSASFSKSAGQLDPDLYKQYEPKIQGVLELYKKAQTSTGTEAKRYLNQANIEAEKLKGTFQSIVQQANELKNVSKESELTAKMHANAASQKASFQQYLQTLDPTVLKQYDGDIQDIFNNFGLAANSAGDDSRKALENAANGMKNFKGQMKELGAEGANIFTHLHSKLKTFTVYLISSAVTMAAVSGIRNAINVVYDLNEALTDLRIVTGDSNANAEKLLATYNKMAQSMGSTTKVVADAAVEWQRQGYNLEDTNTLIENSMVLSIVGMVDSAEASKYLTSAIKGNDKYSLYVQKCA